MQTEASSKKNDEVPYNFCTGSSYVGGFDDEGKMSGYGKYRFPNGIEYHGYFKSGIFHGPGMLIHPTQFKECGIFVNGNCEDYQTFFSDGLQYHQDEWKYCTKEDRRFWMEIVQGISPVGEQFLTKEKPARHIPRGCFDTIEGFFDPDTEHIVDADTGNRIRYVCPEEKVRIMKSCRMNEIDFYEREELVANSKDRDISTDSWISSDESEYCCN